jgi:hypothetical protein
MATLQRYLVVAGVTVLVAFIAATQILSRSPFDSGTRGGARGAVTAAGFLEIIWVILAATVATTRWRSTTTPLRVILALNSIIALLLVVEFFR